MNEPTELEKRILKTIIYFDLFNYPMTSWEVWKWLINESGKPSSQVEFHEVLETLQQSQYLKNKIKIKNNFYFLNQHDRLADERMEKYVIAWQKFRKVRRIVKILKLIPFIKMVAVCNDLAYFNAPADSDIDLFIITAKKRIWITRFLAVFIIKLLGLRPTERNKKDKICLSIFVNEDKLNLEYLKINPDDIHFIYWLENLIPIYDADGYYQRLREANAWINNFIPQAFPYEPNLRQKVSEGKLIKIIKNIFSFLTLDFDENFYRWFQNKKFSPKIQEMMNKDTRVVVNDQILKFHTNDNREDLSLKFKQKCEELI